MIIPKFLQLHYLSPYAGVNLNRGDDNQPKRMYFGDYLRGRISSQCLKRHWAKNDDGNSIHSIDGAVEDFRSRELISGKVMPAVREAGEFAPEVLAAVEDEFNRELYGKNGADFKNRQALLLSLPEVNHMVRLATEVCGQSPEDPEEAGAEARRRFAAERQNFMVMREGAEVRHGLRVAMFGRMVTSFTDATVDAPVHVAHAFTVHAEECEVDHFSTVDDLLPDGQGQAAYLGETQVNSGLYYGYVVVDVPGLVQNLEAVPRSRWLEADRGLAGALAEKLIMTIATVTPGAKKGSTAPYTRASLLLAEFGDQQPRTLAEAFRDPIRSAQTGDAVEVLSGYLEKMDRMYGQGEVRRSAQTDRIQIAGARDVESAMELAGWARGVIRDGEAL